MKKILLLFLMVLTAACSQKIVPPGEAVKPVSESHLRGQAIFMQRCHRCHPEGMAGLGPAIINKPLPGFLMRLQIRAGLGTMPSFNKNQLTENQLDDLILYIKEIRRD